MRVYCCLLIATAVVMAVVVEQDSTLQAGGKRKTIRTRTTARWRNWKRPSKDTSLLTLFRAVLRRIQASRARSVSLAAAVNNTEFQALTSTREISHPLAQSWTITTIKFNMQSLRVHSWAVMPLANKQNSVFIKPLTNRNDNIQ